MKIPFSSDCLIQKFWISTSWDAVDTVIRAHNAASIAFLDTHFKWSKECLHHILLGHLQNLKKKN